MIMLTRSNQKSHYFLHFCNRLLYRGLRKLLEANLTALLTSLIGQSHLELRDCCGSHGNVSSPKVQAEQAY